MDKAELLEKLKLAVAEGEEDDAVQLAKDAVAAGIPPMEILNGGAAKGMDIIGEKYNSGEAFLPELVFAGDTMTSVLDILFASMSAKERSDSQKGVVVIGQAKGDVHDIGKNIVSAILAVNGFAVHDLGTDVDVKAFAEKAKAVGANIVAVSTLLTTSLPFMRDIVNYFRDSGTRASVNIIFGGGPVTPEFTQDANADGWSRSATDCVELCRKLMQGKVGGEGAPLFVDSETA